MCMCESLRWVTVGRADSAGSGRSYVYRGIRAGSDPAPSKAFTEMDAVGETTRAPPKAFTEIDAVGETTRPTHKPLLKWTCSAKRPDPPECLY